MSVIALSVTGCSGDSSADDGNTVRFGYISDYNGASLLAIADKQGLWKKQGLSPRYQALHQRPPAGSRRSAPATSTSATSAPAPCGCPPPARRRSSRSTPSPTPTASSPGPASPPSRTSRARRSACPQGTSGDMVLNLALRKAGMTEKDIEKVPMDTVHHRLRLRLRADRRRRTLVPADRHHQGRSPGLHRGGQHRGLPGPRLPHRVRLRQQDRNRPLTAKVVTVLQKANDWRAAHPDESIDAAASLLKADRGQGGGGRGPCADHVHRRPGRQDQGRHRRHLARTDSATSSSAPAS